MVTSSEEQKSIIEHRIIFATKWPFIALCSYLLSQIFTIPLIPKGPWAVWITLSDITAGLMMLTSLIFWKHLRAKTRASDTVSTILLITLASSLLSFTFFVLFPSISGSADMESLQASLNFGLYEAYRMVQFSIIYWLARRVPLDEKRVCLLRKLSIISLTLVCIGIILSYFEILPQQLLVAHLPHGFKAAGAWADFATFNGLGTIGYNHGYVALQVMILLGLAIHFTPSGNRWYIVLLLVLALTAVLLSGSRAGMIGTGLYAAYLGVQRPRYLIVGFSLLAVVLVILPQKYIEEMIPAIKRGSSISTSYQSDGFAGRSQIWDHTVNYLHEHPERLVLGDGLGNSGGRDAHNNYLQVLFEFGVIGLAYFIVVMVMVLRMLYQYESGLKSLFWMTLALLITGFTQETFYPVVSFGHFLGLYFLTLAIAFNRPQDETAYRVQRRKAQLGISE